MNSRVEKYDNPENNTEIPSRVARNQNLYNELSMSDFSDLKPNDNVKVIENTGNRIDLNKIKDYLESNEEEKIQKIDREYNIIKNKIIIISFLANTLITI